MMKLTELYDKYGCDYKAEDIIFFKGDYGDCFYIIYSGQVGVVNFNECKMQTIRILKDGCMFGEFAFFSKNIRTATVVANTDVSLIRISYPNMFKILLSDEGLFWFFLNDISEKLQCTLEMYKILSLKNVQVKIHQYLSNMARHKNYGIDLKELSNITGQSVDKLEEMVSKREDKVVYK